jgi:SAM-dependent methyltransferase
MQGALAKPNFPTVSEPSAMRDFPNVRNNERDTLLGYATLRPGCVVLDVQAAGGYLSDEVRRRLGSAEGIICVEPNAELRSRLNPAYTIVADPVERFGSIGDDTVDIALGLVGLHHSRSHGATIGECHRVLKPGGELAICDVPAGSRLADWLNGFVASHCPAGHEGNFPALGSVARLCREAGFVEIAEEVRDVPWQFERRADIATFFKGLFGLSINTSAIERAIDDYFTVRTAASGCTVDWQLVYAHARKPG